jgi:hypothetical protein
MRRKIFIRETTLSRVRRRIYLFRTKVPPEFGEELKSICMYDIGLPNKTITFSLHTPVVFRELGMSDYPMVMYRDKLARGLYLISTEEHGHMESLDKDIVKKTVLRIADPIAVFDSKQKGKFVALYDIEDLHGNWIIVSVLPGKNLRTSSINLITSLYGKDRNHVLAKWCLDGLLRYFDDKKMKALTARLRLPSVSFSFINSNVLTKSAIVKKYDEG